jgi:hypothetical protein
MCINQSYHDLVSDEYLSNPGHSGFPASSIVAHSCIKDPISPKHDLNIFKYVGLTGKTGPEDLERGRGHLQSLTRAHLGNFSVFIFLCNFYTDLATPIIILVVTIRNHSERQLVERITRFDTWEMEQLNFKHGHWIGDWCHNFGKVSQTGRSSGKSKTNFSIWSSNRLSEPRIGVYRTGHHSGGDRRLGNIPA